MHQVTQRFIECVDLLVKENKVRSYRQFALSLEVLPQNLNEIIKRRRDVTIDLLYKAIEKFDLNPDYVFKGKGTLFSDALTLRKLQTLNIVTDSGGNERILHVPQPAQAGYTSEVVDAEYIETLPTYTLPDPRFQYGTHRSFDIAGDSMFPSLEEGNVVVCSFIEPYRWEDSIGDGKVYVIVTHTSIVVKRIKNNLRMHRHLELLSDNESYTPYRLNIGEIKEVWEVKKVIADFNHYQERSKKKGDQDQVQFLQSTIEKQGKMIEGFQKLLENNLQKISQ
jgi:phage repressor protein C with HTH and peptisase S24 domain